MDKKEIYSGFQICETLGVKELCFRLMEYNEGDFEELFHEHIPRHRISSENAFEFMRALVVKHKGLSDDQILRGYINSRGKNPSSISICRGIVEYPEPGVMRRYCDGGNVHAWHDEVIDQTSFRQ